MLVQSIRFASTLAVASLLACAGASATSVVPMDLEEMAKASPNIVHATVISTNSHWNEDKTVIVTDVKLRVHDALKGGAAGEITVTQLGGVVGALRVEVPGVAAFRPDQEAVLFLSPQKNGNHAITGFMQGQFDVLTDEKTGQKTVRGLTAQKLGDPGKATAPQNGSEGLDAFKSRIRKIVHELEDDSGR